MVNYVTAGSFAFNSAHVTSGYNVAGFKKFGTRRLEEEENSQNAIDTGSSSASLAADPFRRELSGGGGGNATPTPHFGEVEGYTGETAVAEFSMTNAGWDVKDVTIPAGHFKVRLTNNGGKIRQLIAQRWKVQLQAEPGETRDSPVYVEMVPGTYPCFEAGRGSKPQWKCNIIIA